jgi:hypothetical protein
MKTLFTLLILFTSICFAQREKELPITIEEDDSISSVIDDGYYLFQIIIPDTSLLDGTALTFQNYSEGQWIDYYDYNGDLYSLTVGRGKSSETDLKKTWGLKSKWRVLASTEQDTTVIFKALLKPIQ